MKNIYIYIYIYIYYIFCVSTWQASPFWISNFRHVVNVVFFLLRDSPTSELCADVSEHSVCSTFIGSVNKKPYDGEQFSETSEHKFGRWRITQKKENQRLQLLPLSMQGLLNQPPPPPTPLLFAEDIPLCY